MSTTANSRDNLRRSLRRTGAIARKELLHIVRDTRSLIAALALPLMMLLLFGFALSLDVDHIPMVVYDLDRSPQSRALIQDFRASRFFDIVSETGGYKSIERSMDQRDALLGLVIPNDFSKDLLAGKTAQVQLLLDGSDSNTAAIAMGYAEGVVQTHALQLRADAQARRSGEKPATPVEARIRVWYNTDLVSRDYIVPGLIAVIIMIIASLLTSLCIAREWENGSMEALLSTPLRPWELALGKLSAYFLLGIADLLISLVTAVFVMDVPLKGSVLLLLFSSSVFVFGALAWGVFVSAATRNQLAAYQLGTLTSFLPAFMLSGFIYSLDNMPFVIQTIALFVPARYFINIVKGVFLKGVGLELLWFDLLLLIGYAALIFFWTTRKLRQKVT
jgi:ABC-2 type transport system permease protein